MDTKESERRQSIPKTREDVIELVRWTRKNHPEYEPDVTASYLTAGECGLDPIMVREVLLAEWPEAAAWIWFPPKCVALVMDELDMLRKKLRAAEGRELASLGRLRHLLERCEAEPPNIADDELLQEAHDDGWRDAMAHVVGEATTD